MDFCMSPDWGLKSQPWHIRMMLQPGEVPGQGTVCSFLPEQRFWRHSVIHNHILAKCHSGTKTLCTYLRNVQAEARLQAEARRDTHLRDQKTLNPKQSIGTLGTKLPCGGRWSSWRGRNGNLRSGLSVKKQLLHCIMFKQTIQLTSFLSQVRLEPVLLRRK